MKTLLLTTLLLSGCVSPIIAVPVALVVAIPADRGANYVLGGNPHHTITTDDAIARDHGDEAASNRCILWDATVSWYDLGYFDHQSWVYFRSEEQNGHYIDHCSRWELYETGQLEKLKRLPN